MSVALTEHDLYLRVEEYNKDIDLTFPSAGIRRKSSTLNELNAILKVDVPSEQFIKIREKSLSRNIYAINGVRYFSIGRTLHQNSEKKTYVKPFLDQSGNRYVMWSGVYSDAVKNQTLADWERYQKVLETLRDCPGVVQSCFHVTIQKADHVKAKVLMSYYENGDVDTLLTETNEFKLHHLMQALKCLAEIHARGIVHGDFKLGNILVNKQGEIGVADFEFSCFEKDKVKQNAGSMYIISPEYLDGDVPFLTKKVDIWAAGVLILYVIDRLKQWGIYDRTPLPLFFRNISYYLEKVKCKNKDLANLLERIFDNDPDNRPTAQAVYEAMDKLLPTI